MRTLYGPAMTQGLASGDLAELQRLEAAAEAHLNEYGDVSTLLAVLKIEIAKLEHGGKH